ncbi:MAG: TrkA domain protein [uncultured Sulfurovum sp.]|uniref:TrkA domain protein n=1 Tax=uncultured Sulfurovum sp. TaxID=269237 RepID=A0A6S6TTP4_9BACT|nr:MAG: TrkA domain protein [uncultured Sulfurovum sp.]
MKNILILASGTTAKHFMEWIGKKRVAENNYYVTCYTSGTTPEVMGKNITLIDADPTSYSKLSRIMNEVYYNAVFIIMEDKTDAQYALKNLKLIDNHIRIVLLNQWDDKNIGQEQSNVTLIHKDELMAAHLYDHLPNVPLVAQNVGLGHGEIMEILIPFGSSYAYRHVGSIVQRKWNIVAIYRDQKQILPTASTMIRPNDTLLVVGKPLILHGVYKTINKRIGLFPEPFGKNIYLILDFRYDKKNTLAYVKECIYFLDKLENKTLYIRILYPNDFSLIDEMKQYESQRIIISTSYEETDSTQLIINDIEQYDIGMILNSIKTFNADKLKDTLYDMKKIVYLFGDSSLKTIEHSIVLMSDNKRMESISSAAFDVSESLGLQLKLCDFDPEGDFESKKMIIEHYETLTHIFNLKIETKNKIANPIREISKMNNILQVAPFETDLNTMSFKKYISMRIQDFLLTTKRHPKLLIPFINS